MSRRLAPVLATALLAAALLAPACDRAPARREPPPVSSPDARPPALPPATLHRFAPPTAAERAHDGPRAAALRAVVAALGDRLADAVALARTADPTGFGAAREAYLARFSPLRNQVLALDPLRQRSWGAQLAHRLLDVLTVHLVDAIPEATRERSSGAFETRRRDAAALLHELRGYVDSLGP